MRVYLLCRFVLNSGDLTFRAVRTLFTILRPVQVSTMQVYERRNKVPFQPASVGFHFLLTRVERYTQPPPQLSTNFQLALLSFVRVFFSKMCFVAPLLMFVQIEKNNCWDDAVIRQFFLFKMLILYYAILYFSRLASFLQFFGGGSI